MYIRYLNMYNVVRIFLSFLPWSKVIVTCTQMLLELYMNVVMSVISSHMCPRACIQSRRLRVIQRSQGS